MKAVILILVILCLPIIAVAQLPKVESPAGEPSKTLENTRFDGTWNVSYDCPPHSDGVKGFGYKFSVRVKDGVLHGQHGTEGVPGWLQLEGKIQPDGTAYLDARSVTGDRDFNINHAPERRRFVFHVKARFEGSRGTGSRVEGRTCNFEFVKR